MGKNMNTSSLSMSAPKLILLTGEIEAPHLTAILNHHAPALEIVWAADAAALMAGIHALVESSIRSGVAHRLADAARVRESASGGTLRQAGDLQLILFRNFRGARNGMDSYKRPTVEGRC